jgi:hypothetical protein
MADTPSWLQASNDAPVPTPSSSTTAAPIGSMNLDTNNAATASGTNGTTSSTPDDKDLPSVILLMRLTNMGVAGALIAISVRCLLFFLCVCVFLWTDGRGRKTGHTTSMGGSLGRLFVMRHFVHIVKGLIYIRC